MSRAIRSGRTVTVVVAPAVTPASTSARDAVARPQAQLRDGALHALDLELEQVRDPDEPGDEGRVGLVVDLLRRAHLQDPARVHDRDAIAHRQRLVLVVGDVDEGDPDLGLDPLELDLQLLAQLQVQRAQGLVEQEHAWAVDQGAGERNALALAARELARPPVVEALELHHPERLTHPCIALGARDAS